MFAKTKSPKDWKFEDIEPKIQIQEKRAVCSG